MLRIARFVTRCEAPKDRPEAYSLVRSIAGESMAGELGAFLGPSLARQTGVARIRRLRVRIRVRGKSINRTQLMDAWVRAITRQLFTALAYPHGGGSFEVERAASESHFRAAFIRDLLSGAARGKWTYRGREALISAPKAEGVLGALRESPRDIVETLDALDGLGSLEPALAVLDEIAFEEIFRTIATAGAVTAEANYAQVFADVARVLARHPLSRGLRLDSRSQALRLFVHAQRLDIRWSPRVWFATLTSLALLAEHGELWTDSTRTVEQICGRQLYGDAVATIQALRPALAGIAGTDSVHRKQVLEALQCAGLATPEPSVAATDPAPWREYAGASLLLLTGTLEQLGWPTLWKDAAGQAALYALGCAVRAEFDPAVRSLDPDAALFAGMFGEVSREGLRNLFASTAPPSEGGSDDWKTAMDALAGRLVAAWTERLPGFRKASRAAVVRQFLKSPGRVRIEEGRVLAHLAANPVFTALHIASLDAPVENVRWFGGRRLEFRLEGM